MLFAGLCYNKAHMQCFTLSTTTLLIALLLASPAYAQQTDYKQFGQSAIEELDFDPHADLSDAELVEHIKEKHGTLGKLAAGALFFLSPVKKVKLLSLLGLTALGTMAWGDDDAGGLTQPEEEEEKEPDPPATPCTRNEPGYFQLSGTNNECIKLPRGNFSFNESSDAVLPAREEATIKIEFDSEIVFVNGSQWSELGEEEVLEMIEVSHEFWDDVTIQDYKQRINIDNSNQKTVITLEAPREILPYGVKIYGWAYFGNWALKIGNYAKKVDAQKIIQSDNFANYLELTEVEKDFIVSTSCNNGPSTGLGGEKMIMDKLDSIESQPVVLKKADPTKTYYIDVGFVVSEAMLRRSSLHEWDSLLKQRYFPKVNQIFQNSGVNVEFRVKTVRPFSEYREHLACPGNVSSIDFLGPHLFLLAELVPEIRNDHEVDLVYGILQSHSRHVGNSLRRLKDMPVSIGARFGSVSSLTDSDPGSFIVNLTQRLGENLGLMYWHEQHSRSRSPLNFTGYGFGHHDFPLSTIMNDSDFDSLLSSRRWIPLFSANKKMSKFEICQNDVFNDIEDFGLCNNWPTYLPDSEKRSVGSSTANSSEALQYTIEDASNYSNY